MKWKPDILKCLLDESCLMPKIFSFCEVRVLLKEYQKKIKADLLEIADNGEIEDLRREVEKFFENKKMFNN